MEPVERRSRDHTSGDTTQIGRRMQLQAALTLAEELADTVLGDSADT
jgi:hypothetical protein